MHNESFEGSLANGLANERMDAPANELECELETRERWLRTADLRSFFTRDIN